MVSAQKRLATMSRPWFETNPLPYKGNNFCFSDNLVSCALTGLYSVVVLVFGQQPVSAVADGLDIGQQPGVASPAQHGLVQSGGQTFGQQHLPHLFGQHFSGQQQFSQSSGQHFAGQQLSSDCPGLFCAGQQLVVASPGQHGLVRPSGQVFAAGHGVWPVA